MQSKSLMSNIKQSPAILLLEDGTVFHGKSAGEIGTTTGEICFNTGMTGYEEVFTDPSYFGQILVMTVNHIGNYGTLTDEMESDDIKIAGLVSKNFSSQFSRKLSDKSLHEFLLDNNIVSITDLDTRQIVRHIRSKGAMNAIISSEETNFEKLKQKLSEVPPMVGLELSSKVSTRESYFFGNDDAKYKIAILDLGVKKNILKCLVDRDCYLKVFPAKTKFKEMESWNPDGYFLSNGPGDPSSMPYVVETTKEILSNDAPLFGICLGHQILALANGISTYKMHHGHRGLNHPVKNLITGKAEITSQNHGFGVDSTSLKKVKNIEVTHINLNDDSIEGLKLTDKKAFSVQYHPESSPGPHDSRYLFDDFIDLIKNESLKTVQSSNEKKNKISA